MCFETGRRSRTQEHLLPAKRNRAGHLFINAQAFLVINSKYWPPELLKFIASKHLAKHPRSKKTEEDIIKSLMYPPRRERELKTRKAAGAAVKAWVVEPYSGPLSPWEWLTEPTDVDRAD